MSRRPKKGVRSRYGPVRSQYGPRWAKRGQQKAETEQILDIRGTGQSRVAELGAGNQLRLNGPCPPPPEFEDFPLGMPW